jgi:hypothetical protein
MRSTQRYHISVESNDTTKVYSFEYTYIHKVLQHITQAVVALIRCVYVIFAFTASQVMQAELCPQQ